MELYEGIVVNNNDPKKVGRCQIRIPVLHGNGIAGKSIGNEGLPWFDPCVSGYGGYQSGSLIIPPVGSVLWCLIDNASGNAYRIYIGGSYGVGAKGDKEFGGKEVPRGQLETPTQAVQGYPNTAVVFKSLQGSIIYVDNTGAIIVDTGKAKMTLTGGQVNIDASSVRIKGTTTILGTLSVSGKTTLNNELEVAKNALLKKELKVQNNVEFEKDLHVIGKTILDDEVTINNNTKIDGTLDVSDDSTFTNIEADEVKIGGLEFSKHKHTSGEEGEDTGEPH